jgi:hypothetical protein
LLCAALSLAAAPVLAQSTAEPIDMDAALKAPALTRMQKEVASVMALWPGDYDNREQVQIDADMGRKTEAQGAHRRVHAAVRRVDLPRIGTHVLYIEDYVDNDASKSFRHGLYVLSAEETAKAVRVALWGFKEPQKWLGAVRDLDRLKALTRAELTETPGCDVLLRRDGDEIGGGTDPKTCLTAKNRALDFQLRLTSEQASFRERSVDAKSGKAVAEFGGFAWHQMERARFFSCMVDPPRPQRREDGVGTYTVRIHDQGGTFTFKYVDGRTLFMSLRNTWSYNMNRKTLVVTLQENDENGKGLGYAWAQPGADRLGMNPLWIHIQCDLDTPENLQFQRSMRSVL